MSTVSRPSGALSEVDARARHLATRLVAIAETLGLVLRSEQSRTDLPTIRAAFAELARVGVGRHSAELPTRVSAATMSAAADHLLESVEGSPLPDLEWTPISEVLGDELLARLVGISASSLHRYRASERATPDSVAERLHQITLVVSDLSGSYNDLGIRRWFARPRTALGGRAPAEIFAGKWSPDDGSVREARHLARALLGAGIA